MRYIPDSSIPKGVIVHKRKNGSEDKRFRKGQANPNYGRSMNALQRAASAMNYVKGFVIQRTGGNTLNHLRRADFYVSAKTNYLCRDIDRLSEELKLSVTEDYERTKILIKENDGE